LGGSGLTLSSKTSGTARIRFSGSPACGSHWPAGLPFWQGQRSGWPWGDYPVTFFPLAGSLQHLLFEGEDGEELVTLISNEKVRFQADRLLKVGMTRKRLDGKIHIGFDLRRVLQGIGP